MIETHILPEFADAAPDYRLILLEADVSNSQTPETLTREIQRFADSVSSVMEIPHINQHPAIAATRQAYRRAGKDPNRYRPSQEQLYRRILKGQGLYTVSALVDAGNLLSLITGCSVGIFDRDKVQGDTLTLGIGQPGEPYEGIGRGVLNIEGMPVVRDAAGGIGTPTSDNVCTQTELSTTRIVATIHLFSPETDADAAISEATRLLTDYCNATNLEYKIIRFRV